MAITRRVVKTFGFVYLSPLLCGVAIKTFDLVYLFHFVYEAAIKTHWLCCFVVLSLSTSQLFCCVKFKYHLSSRKWQAQLCLIQWVLCELML